LSKKPTAAGAEKAVMHPAAVSEKYPPMTRAELAASLGVPLSQKGQPDFSKAVPTRLVSLEEAIARKLSWFWSGTTGTCRYGHNNAARYVSNHEICADCKRVKQGLAPIYGTNRAERHYPEPRRKPKDPNTAAAVVSAAAAAPAPLKIELPKRETEFLAAYAETNDLDAACLRANFSKGLVEARLSSNPPFRTAFDDLKNRLGLTKTRAPDATFDWSDDVERRLVKRYIDSGSMQTARSDLGVSASELMDRKAKNPAFAAAIEEARRHARETLRDVAILLAREGNNINLLKLLEDDEPDTTGNTSPEEQNEALRRLLDKFDKMNILLRTISYKRISTGEIIRADDLEDFETNHGPAVPKNNNDLVGAPRSNNSTP
jgi:hypothetical protein